MNIIFIQWICLLTKSHISSTVFIQTDAHPLHHQAPGTQKIGEIDDYLKCMYLRSDIEPIIYAAKSFLALTQCATIRMNTV